eukprot:8043220-Heterocapsa_arctica.AAC.1
MSASCSRNGHPEAHLPEDRVHPISSPSHRRSSRSRRRSRSRAGPLLRHSAVRPPPECSV